MSLTETTTTQTYTCTFNDCNYQSTSQTRFDWHVNKHTGHPCEIATCEYVGKTKSHLKKHMVVHSSVKPYKCEVIGCSFASRQKVNLKTHLSSVHTSEKKWPCSIEGMDMLVYVCMYVLCIFVCMYVCIYVRVC